MLPPLRPIFPQLAERGRIALNFLIIHGGLLVCALFLLVGLATAGDYGISTDELNQRRIAQTNLDYILGRADRIEPYRYQDRVYGVAFELPLLLAERVLGLADYYYVHRLRLSLTHLFFIVGGFFCYRLAYHLFGSRSLALLALLFYLLHPRLYGHSFFNSKDLPFLSMFAIALYLLERAFRRDTLGAFVVLGIAVGALTNLRIMGIMLLPAVMAMRGLDWFQAGDGAERKHILWSGGLFFLVAGLTVYGLSPYAWTNPVDYLAASLEQTVGHTTAWLQLFQGAWISSEQLPPHYNAVWFGITTPPLIMLLGFIGMLGQMAAGGRRPGAVFGNTRRRFWWLLLACFLLPPLAAALLSSNQYDDWRHFYFLYVPFGLLAAGGLGGLTAALARRRRWRVGMYGLTGAGLGLLLLQMTQLHAVQDVYFNFLVDRTTPEYLRTQFNMNYLRSTAKAALERLPEIHPGATLVVRTPPRHLRILPAASRQWLLPADGAGPVDYELIRRPASSQGDLAFNAAYRRRIYNNTQGALRPLDSSRMTPAAIAAYRGIYRQAIAGEPIVRADYDVYLEDNRLTFVREKCRRSEPWALFTVKLFSHRPETLPPHLRNPGSYALFQNSRVRLGAVCLAVIQMPDYAQGDLMLRQEGADGEGWEELYSITPPPYFGLAELIAEHRRKEPRPAGAAAWDVFIDRGPGRHRLIYAKGDCTRAEYETPITLHIYPENRADLPGYNRGNGFDNRDFPIAYYGGRPGGECVAVVPLPDYPITALATGQSGVWSRNLYPPVDPEVLRADYAVLSDRRPAARSDFDLYVQDNRLIYLRESCAAADTAPGFFLQIVPRDTADLAAERESQGYANWGFDFARWGGHFAGRCLAAVPLPEYPIAAIRTGQAGEWAARFYRPPAAESLRAAWAALSEVQPVVRSGFDLYVQDNRLTYRRESCAAADTAVAFFLHIIPRDAADLPAERQREGYANLDFDFARWGGHFDGQCLAAVPLPDYPIAAVRTGQRNPGQGGFWAVRLITAPDYDRLRADYAALSGLQPAVSSDFDLHIQDNRLLYLRETCVAGNTTAGFFLHITPEDAADLPAERQAAGFASEDFAFARWGGRFDGKCLAAVPLPEYPIAYIRTGQAGVWEVNLYPPADPDDLRSEYAALAEVQPNARAEFELYLRNNRLVYLRESCAAADTAAGFFLHIIPAEVGDLPAEGRDASFANLDFAFNRYGGSFDGKCLATIPLPDYQVKAIRTGQYVAGQGEVWAVELAVGR